MSNKAGYARNILHVHLKEKNGFTWEEEKLFFSYWSENESEYPYHVILSDLTEEEKVYIVKELRVNDFDWNEKLIRSTDFYKSTIEKVQAKYKEFTQGSTKQMEWAVKIREKFSKEFAKHYFFATYNEMQPNYYDTYMKAALVVFSQDRASYYIDNRDSLLQRTKNLAVKYKEESDIKNVNKDDKQDKKSQRTYLASFNKYSKKEFELKLDSSLEFAEQKSKYFSTEADKVIQNLENFADKLPESEQDTTVRGEEAIKDRIKWTESVINRFFKGKEEDAKKVTLEQCVHTIELYFLLSKSEDTKVKNDELISKNEESNINDIKRQAAKQINGFMDELMIGNAIRLEDYDDGELGDYDDLIELKENLESFIEAREKYNEKGELRLGKNHGFENCIAVLNAQPKKGMQRTSIIACEINKKTYIHEI